MPRVREVRIINNVEHWRCSHCKEWLTRRHFAESNSATHKLQSRCTACSRQMSEARLLAKKEASIAKEKQRFQAALERQKRQAQEYRERKARQETAACTTLFTCDDFSAVVTSR